WQDDSVEVYIDGNHNHATTYELTGGTNGLGNDRQFTKGYNDSTLAGTGSQTGVTHAWAAITGGYTVEIAIPWSNINVAGAAAGLTIGFDVANNDDDNGGATRESQVVWAGTGTNYQNTSAFGDLTLSASIVGDGAPEVNVTGNGVTIADGATTPQVADNTDFGSADITTGTVQKIFNIQNTGTATLTLGNVTTTNSEFGVLTQPAPNIAAGGNSNFEIAFIPTDEGLRTATISFNSNDANENPYNFAVQGTGTSAPAVGWSTKPFRVLEAEDGVIGGGAVLLNTSYEAGTPQFEASGRKAVRLSDDNDFVRFTVPAGFNGGTSVVGLVVRASIPDVFSGTASLGQDGQMRVYVNGSPRNVIEKEKGSVVTGTMTISSKYAWVYGAPNPVTGFNDVAPNGYAKNTFCGYWFQDCRYVIQGAVNAGDTIELQANVTALVADSFTHVAAIPAGITASKYCIVDLVQLENVGTPVANPDPNQYLNITAAPYNAIPNDTGDDRPAITSALAAAVSQGKLGIYIPAGTFMLNSGETGGNSDAIELPAGKSIQGAGVWHTMLRHTRNVGRGIDLHGGSPKLRDFSFYGIKHARGGDVGQIPNVANYGIAGDSTGCIIERLWISTISGGWVTSVSGGGIFRNNRVINM
ncbi:MAG: sugar-binding protein, partial [Opitutaceae bacterium]